DGGRSPCCCPRAAPAARRAAPPGRGGVSPGPGRHSAGAGRPARIAAGAQLAWRIDMADAVGRTGPLDWHP
ncbi:tRNA glutamyl-Q(34) synthetase GluQRS, partial [Sphingomonas sp. PsM26]|nr:tRNA glutamyl-Q(34) synthetase GluQRS [Sphingomonas sp. PsM26]